MNQVNVLRVIIVLCVFGFFLSSCKHEIVLPQEDPGAFVPKVHPCDPDTVYFENTILPILQTNCAITLCHDAQTGYDDIVFSSYWDIINSDAFDKIKPGDGQGSKMYKVLNETDPKDRMPPDSPLSPKQIALIEKWINQGALNNSCINPCDSINITYTNQVSTILDLHCNGCHSDPDLGDGILLTSFNDVIKQVNNGALYGSVSWSGDYTNMPRYSTRKISQCKIDIIEKWIALGAPM